MGKWTQPWRQHDILTIFHFQVYYKHLEIKFSMYYYWLQYLKVYSKCWNFLTAFTSWKQLYNENNKHLCITYNYKINYKNDTMHNTCTENIFLVCFQLDSFDCNVQLKDVWELFVKYQSAQKFSAFTVVLLNCSYIFSKKLMKVSFHKNQDTTCTCI